MNLTFGSSVNDPFFALETYARLLPESALGKVYREAVEDQVMEYGKEFGKGADLRLAIGMDLGADKKVEDKKVLNNIMRRTAPCERANLVLVCKLYQVGFVESSALMEEAKKRDRVFLYRQSDSGVVQLVLGQQVGEEIKARATELMETDAMLRDCVSMST